MLEQEGYISFNETVFLPSTACFVIPKELLLDFELAHPQLEPVIKCLLRTYEGIYDNRVSINEKLIGRLIKTDVAEVKNKLQQLLSFGIIEYRPQKETPQVYFITNRAPAQYLIINYERYKRRKDDFTARVETITNYMLDASSCRSKLIGQYFGDTEITDCGICDNCLKRNTTSLTETEFDAIKEQVLSMVNVDATVQHIMQSLPGIKKEKFWTVINYLQRGKDHQH
jgi:ATP-dependent DNA helicase RecQ